MVVEQKSLLGGLVSRLDFGEADLGFSQTITGSGKSVAYRIRYTDIPRETTTITVPNRRAIQFAYIGTLVFIAALVIVLRELPQIVLLVGLALAGIFLAVKRYSLITLIQFNTKMGKLQLIQDKQTEIALEEIARRRKQAFLRYYDDLDIKAAPGDARKTLLWLRKQEYVTEQEFADRLAGLDAVTPAGDTPPESRQA